MNDFRTIEIDLAIHKAIEAARTSLSEKPYEILHRLLKIAHQPKLESVDPSAGRTWAGKGVELPHGTLVRMEYNGVSHSGRIEDGKWVIEGGVFDSPSAAAGGVAKTKHGKSPSLDGWIYWYVKRPTDQSWIPLKSLRDGRRFKTLDDLYNSITQ